MVNLKNIVISCLEIFSVILMVDGLGIKDGGRGRGSGSGLGNEERKFEMYFVLHCGSNLFQSSIYGEFIDALEEKDFDVYDVPFNYRLSQKDIDSLNTDSTSSISILGHSSGCSTMLNQW